jgi:hypothetical protein
MAYAIESVYTFMAPVCFSPPLTVGGDESQALMILWPESLPVASVFEFSQRRENLSFQHHRLRGLKSVLPIDNSLSICLRGLFGSCSGAIPDGL